MKRVLVIGNATVDIVLSVRHLPMPGETMLADAVLRCAGGKGLNQAVAASRVGVPTVLVAPIGDDADGRYLRDGVRTEALETAWLASPHQTDTSMITIAGDGENAIVSTAACARWLAPETAADAASRLKPGDILVVQGNLGEAATLAALRAARATGATTMLNTAPLAWDQRHAVAEADIVVANAGEAESLTGLADDGAARRLVDFGARTVIVTRGGDDAILANAAHSERLPIQGTDVVDTAGAGDVTVGTLAGGLALGLGIREALKVALAAASLSVSRPGTTPSFPTADELSRIVASRRAVFRES
ncbi:ribokinase [Bosea sp. CRIB-10]|uniref:PfkB family carbohydrate kinase n=1 Tax=Bosea sp. CRIB-10 TaxID=378404 RepID=UPI0008EF9EEE|nr:PfkB family carbohydrate kinase [Bosea sp. CRIB-10]SFD51817.1 ribokinase [Bosea sp. CRIB-10]